MKLFAEWLLFLQKKSILGGSLSSECSTASKDKPYVFTHEGTLHAVNFNILYLTTKSFRNTLEVKSFKKNG